MSFFRINILKPIILTGTFALAMAFAANDLVNFIGVPLAGLYAYKAAVVSADPMNITMGMLSKKVGTDTYLLLIAGVIMVFTLWFSRKARSVSATEIGLGEYIAESEAAYSYLLGKQNKAGGFPYSTRNYKMVSDKRSYPRYLAMILKHLLIRYEYEKKDQ